MSRLVRMLRRRKIKMSLCVVIMRAKTFKNAIFLKWTKCKALKSWSKTMR